MKVLFAAVLALVFAPQEKLTIKFNPKAGDVLASEQKMSMELKMSMGGNEFSMEQKGLKKQSREIVEVADGRVTKCVLDTPEDWMEQTNPMSPDPMKTLNPLNGKKATAKLVDGKTVVEGEELTDKMKALVQLEDKQVKFLPKQAVAVGEKWELKGDDLKGLLRDDDEMKMKEGKATFTLKEVKEIDKRKCAIIEASMKIKGTIEGKSPQPMTIDFTMKGEFTIWIDRGYVLASKMKGEIKMLMGDEDEPGMEGSGPMTIEETVTVKEK